MRKTIFVNALCGGVIPFCLISVAMTATPAFSQPTAPAKEGDAVAVKMPDDPRKLMTLAVQYNGLEEPSVPPWHLTATFTLFDAQGHPIDHGTFEEFWVSPKKHKFTFASASFTQSHYHSDQGLLLSGTSDPLSDLLTKVILGFVNPLPDSELLREASLSMEKQTAWHMSLSCVSVNLSASPDLTTRMMGSTNCFDADKPLLRTVVDAWGEHLVRKDMFPFHGRYVPRDLEVGRPGKIELTAHLVSIEEIKTINPSDFAAPPDAFKPKGEGWTYISQEEARNLQIGRVKPEYPPAALAAHISGTVQVRATIGVDGHVYNLRVIDGPVLLQQAALDAVSKYHFRTYYRGGKAAIAETVFQLDFHEPTTRK